MEENQLNKRIKILEENLSSNLNDLDTLEDLKENNGKLLNIRENILRGTSIRLGS